MEVIFSNKCGRFGYGKVQNSAGLYGRQKKKCRDGTVDTVAGRNVDTTDTTAADNLTDSHNFLAVEPAARDRPPVAAHQQRPSNSRLN